MSKPTTSIQLGALAGARFPGEIGTAPGFASSLAFKGLLFLMFVIYIAPQAIFPILGPLYLGKVSAFLAVAGYGLVILQGHRLTVMGQEVKLVLWLVVFSLISIPISKWPGGSVEGFTDQFSKSIIVFFLVANLINSNKRLHQVLWAISIFAVFNAGTGLKNYFGGNVIGDNRISGGISWITSNPNDLALSLNLVIPFIWYLFITSKGAIQKLMAGGGLVICVACIVVTFSRGGFVTLVCLLLWYVCTNPWLRGIGAKVLSVCMIIAALVLSLTVGPEGYADRIVSIVDESKDSMGARTSRKNQMEASVRGLLEHPFGVGLGMNNLYLQEEGLGWNGVHNVYLEVASDLGVLAGIVYIVLLWKLHAAMRRTRMSTALPPNLALLAWAAEGSLVAFAVGGMFHPAAYNFYLYISAGIAVAIKEMAKGSHGLQAKSLDERANEQTISAAARDLLVR